MAAWYTAVRHLSWLLQGRGSENSIDLNLLLPPLMLVHYLYVLELQSQILIYLQNTF